MEGVGYEAASLAGHLGLGKLIVLWDDNRISIDGATRLSFSEDVIARFAANGWQCITTDGHNPAAVEAALVQADAEVNCPSLIACRTTIGFGAPSKAGTAASHGAPLGAEEVAGVRTAIDWHEPPFVIPDEVYADWRQAGSRGKAIRHAWQARLDASPHKEAFTQRMSGQVPAAAITALTEKTPKVSIRQTEDGFAPSLRRSLGNNFTCLSEPYRWLGRFNWLQSYAGTRPSGVSTKTQADATSSTVSANTQWRRQ